MGSTRFEAIHFQFKKRLIQPEYYVYIHEIKKQRYFTLSAVSFLKDEKRSVDVARV